MWIKLVGCCLILGSSAMLGLYYSSRLSGRLMLLKQWYQAMQLLKGEIGYRHATLGEAFLEVGRRCGQDVGKWMEQLGEEMQKKHSVSFLELWMPALEQWKKGGILSADDIRLLEDFGKNLGYLDVSMQEQRILFFMEQLETQIQLLNASIEKRKHLYRTISVLGGSFLVVLLL